MNLEYLNIYELRTYGRQVGVKAPTSLKHAELITAIKQIELGEVAPHKGTKGRPLKQGIKKNAIICDAFSVYEELAQIKNNLSQALKQIDSLLK